MSCEGIVKVGDVKRLIAFIPKGHIHTRVLLELNDGSLIIFQQALIDGLIRAYFSISLHPAKTAVELVPKTLGKGVRKQGFAKTQLMESNRREYEVSKFAESKYLKLLQE